MRTPREGLNALTSLSFSVIESFQPNNTRKTIISVNSGVVLGSAPEFKFLAIPSAFGSYASVCWFYAKCNLNVLNMTMKLDKRPTKA